jgi:hypothetical protein
VAGVEEQRRLRAIERLPELLERAIIWAREVFSLTMVVKPSSRSAAPRSRESLTALRSGELG